jgi:hypothetical protein
VLKIGHDKAGSDRRIKLPEVMAAFFTEAAKDKSPQAPCSPQLRAGLEQGCVDVARQGRSTSWGLAADDNGLLAAP